MAGIGPAFRPKSGDTTSPYWSSTARPPFTPGSIPKYAAFGPVFAVTLTPYHFVIGKDTSSRRFTETYIPSSVDVMLAEKPRLVA